MTSDGDALSSAQLGGMTEKKRGDPRDWLKPIQG